MRLFLALDLPGEALCALSGIKEELQQESDGWRWVRPEGIHLTIRFLGEMPPQREVECREVWQAAAAGVGPISFRLDGLGSFPPGAKPRVLFVRIVELSPSGRLFNLADRVERAARKVGFPAQRHPFRAHLTLARAGRKKCMASMPADRDLEYQQAIQCSELQLIQSHLSPQGARYNVLASFPLGEESSQ